MSRPDGGPAFPVMHPMEVDGLLLDHCENEGMSLRDWFAGMALSRMPDGYVNWQGMAEDAYDIADAMLAQQQRESPSTDAEKEPTQ